MNTGTPALVLSALSVRAATTGPRRKTTAQQTKLPRKLVATRTPHGRHPEGVSSGALKFAPNHKLQGCGLKRNGKVLAAVDGSTIEQ